MDNDNVKRLRAKYKASPEIEEINRRERERARKAQKLGEEHGRSGRYDPPTEVCQDTVTKRAYDLGYLSTEKKTMPAVGKGWIRFTARNPEKGDRVRVTKFGDDHGRDGVVTGVMQGGYAFVDFGFKEERFHRNDLELWQ